MKNVFVLLVVCLFASFMSNATNYYVNNNSTTGDVYTSAIGNNSNSGTSPSAPKATLANVLSTYNAVLTSGDRIYIDAGTYSDVNLTLNKSGIRISGAGPAKTVYDNASAGADLNRFLLITASNITIDGLYVKGYNYGVSGASAIQISGATNLIFNNVLTDENRAGGGSSTIVIDNGSSVTFNGGGSNCNSQNTVAGGGVNVEGNGNTVVFNDYSFSKNSKDFEPGSALYISGNNTTSVTINNSIIADNRCTSGGGAVYVSGSNLTVSGSYFYNNTNSLGTGPKYGGAVTVARGATLSFSNCRFNSNIVSNSGYGGAIGIDTGMPGSGSTATVNLTSCSFNANTATSSSGGNHLYARVGYSNPAIFNINQCTFSSTSSSITNGNSASINIQNSGTPSTSGTINFINTLAATTIPVTSYPTLQGSCYGVVLPIEFLDMRAVCVEDERQLIWSTGSEHNNAYFTIETGNEQGEFEVLTTVNGAGNSNHELTYQLPVRDAAYYRLSQTDYDGSKVELKTVSASPCKEQGSEIVYLDNLHAFDLYLKEQFSGDVEFALINSVGQVIERGTQTNDNNSVQRIFLSSFCSDGMYFLQVTAGSVVLSEKFMIRKQ